MPLDDSVFINNKCLSFIGAFSLLLTYEIYPFYILYIIIVNEEIRSLFETACSYFHISVLHERVNGELNTTYVPRMWTGSFLVTISPSQLHLTQILATFQSDNHNFDNLQIIIWLIYLDL